MGEEIKTLKTDTHSALEKKRKICTFTDHAIERFKPSAFDWKTKDGKDRDRQYFKFEGATKIKGLRLVIYKSTSKKFFQLVYTTKKPEGKYVSLHTTIGEFVPGKFGVKQARDKVLEILKDHTNDKGRWIKDPKKTLKDKDNKVYEAEAIKLEKKSIREVIEDIVKDEFPGIENPGNLVASSHITHRLPMFGYNKRTLLMYHANDADGSGRIYYKGNKYYGIAQPANAEDLFKKFPSGVGIITTKKLSKYKNRTSEISLYDHELSKHLIEHLEPQHIRDYINEKERSYSVKRVIKRMFTYIWSYAVEKGYLPGDKLIPTKNIIIKRPTKITNKGAQYNNKRFTEQQLEAIWLNLIQKRQEKFPFSSMALCLYLVTGVREETLLLIKKENIQKDFIILPGAIVRKSRKEHKIVITPPVRWILDNIQNKLNEKKYQKYKFVPWLFPSTKTKSKSLLDPEYVNTHGTRLKDTRGCWLAVMKDLGLEGAKKMLRKSFISMSKVVLKDSFKVMFLSGHTKEATIDIHYNKSTDDQQKEYANEVSDKVFNFNKN